MKTGNEKSMEKDKTSTRVRVVCKCMTHRRKSLADSLFRFRCDAFGDRLFTLLRTNDNLEQNTFFSPLSTLLCCLLVANGCHGRTQEEIIETLRMGSLAKFNDYSKELKDSLKRSGTLFVSNSVWVSHKLGCAFNPLYIKTVKRYSDASARVMTTINDANEWVSQQTGRKIQQALSGEVPDCAIISCIYFKADWLYKFAYSLTKPSDFYPRCSRDKFRVEMMFQEGSFQYLSRLASRPGEDRKDGYQSILLPYVGPFCAVIILPAEGAMEDTAVQIPTVSQLWDELVSSPSRRGTLELPRFKAELEYNMIDHLKAMGIHASFDKAYQMMSGEFSPMLKKKRKKSSDTPVPLYVEKVIQKVFVEVDEKGTEAAAVTAAKLMTPRSKSGPPPEPNFHMICNRPFFFYICASASLGPNLAGKVIFQGEIRNPTKSQIQSEEEPPQIQSEEEPPSKRQKPNSCQVS